MDLPKTGDLLRGKYLLESVLGEGGMGVVYAAQHTLLGRRVAVKFLLPDIVKQGNAVARFLNEARAVSRIENEHVARVLDVDTLESGLPFMVLEYLDGSDLASILKEEGPMPVDEVVDYMLQTIEAVAHAHALGIVHRDLKPANLFLARRQDGTVRVKVLDFGISKALGGDSGTSANITKTSAMLGSPLYMSPEQLRDAKSVDHRCDIWALGVVAYQLLSGRPPFQGDNAVALFAAILEQEPESLCASRSDLAEELDAAILKCLRRRPDERFSSVTELASHLVPFGTFVGANAFENAKRILPLSTPGASLPPPARRSSGAPVPLGSSSSPALLGSSSVSPGPRTSSAPPGPRTASAPPGPRTASAPPGPRTASVPPGPRTASVPPDAPIVLRPSKPPALGISSAPPSLRPSGAPAPLRIDAQWSATSEAAFSSTLPADVPALSVSGQLPVPIASTPPKRRSMAPVALAASAGLALLVGAGLFMWPKARPVDTTSAAPAPSSVFPGQGSTTAIVATNTPSSPSSVGGEGVRAQARPDAAGAPGSAQARTAGSAQPSGAMSGSHPQPKAPAGSAAPGATAKPASSSRNCNPPHDFDPACLIP